MLYPLRFKPILKQKIWGGTKLHFKSSVPLKNQKIGESWEVSGINSDISVVSNGPLQGQNLQDLILKFESDFVGKSVFKKFKSQFPILIKFIEAKEKLSVQLHPDDILAKKRHNSFGKTEMWYITEAEKDASLIIDFKEQISVQEYKNLLEDGEIESALNSIKVKEGDTFFIKPGLVHAIGSGVLLAEIQQTSDITYRIFDWNRTNDEGESRELHTDLALEAIDFSRKSDYRIPYTPKLNSKVTLARTPYFKTEYIDISGVLHFDLVEIDSFLIYMNVGLADAIFHYDNIDYLLPPKETLLIPACLNEIQISSEDTKLLEISI
jgi:mannose-6-phosphate isomerase